MGLFTLSSVPPGPYDVVIEAAGFQKATQQVTVSVGAVTEVSATLKVSGAATTVEVTGSGNAATVNIENATLGAVVTSQQVNELPTLTRNPYDLVGISGGGVADTNVSPNTPRGVGYAINGQRSASTDILLDGGQNVDLFTSGTGQIVPLDSVNEFSVLTNNFGAEYGRASGGIVNVVTKSGSNDFHGSAYEYNRVAALSSNTYQNDATATEKGGFTRNQFGFAIGGPIIKNKLFFFNNTEWVRVRAESPTQYNIIDPSSYSQLGLASQNFFNAYGKLAPGVTTKSVFPCRGISPEYLDGSCPRGLQPVRQDHHVRPLCGRHRRPRERRPDRTSKLSRLLILVCPFGGNDRLDATRGELNSVRKLVAFSGQYR